ncbi:MAG: SPOR domain-containing protein [Bacteroidetes bacterium]|nr:SPOR domain-containing protein [Bacteroidota bacterium]
MKKSIVFLLLFSFILFVSACSSTKESTDIISTQETDSLYVFDAPVDKSKDENLLLIPNIANVKLYIVQIGAFTTLEKAEKFAIESRKKIKYNLDIEYSNSVNLYVVQLKPFYNIKEDAETVKNNLWKITDFEDAWILTVIR